MNDIKKLDDFNNFNEELIIFVVGQEYLHSSKGSFLKEYYYKENWISSDKAIERKIKRMIRTTQKNVPNIAELVPVINNSGFSFKKIDIPDIILALCKLFAANEHIAIEDKVINPIIIEEGKVSKKVLTQYVTLHEKNKFRPTIIVLLRDNDYSKVEKIFSNCPNNTNIKIVYPCDNSTYYRVINQGADNITDFLDSYARQCFSSCSHTEHKVLISPEFGENSLVTNFSPTIFQIRSIFIREHKLDAVKQVTWLNDELTSYNPKNDTDRILKNSLKCISNLFQVYCNDDGTKLPTALYLANELNNDILKAHVYRYSHFLNCSRQEKQELLKEAEQIFKTHNIYDHAIYCQNNNLIHQFSFDSIKINDFKDIKSYAKGKTPGLVLMAHILNNVGVAYLLDNSIEEAIAELDDALQFAYTHIQKLALESNLLIAKSVYGEPFNYNKAKSILNEIFNSPSLGINKMPFLTAQFALNVIGCAYLCNNNVATELLHQFRVLDLVRSAFNTNIMGTGSMIKQMEILSTIHSDFKLMEKLSLPTKRTPISGTRYKFITNYGLNPFFFNTWL